LAKCASPVVHTFGDIGFYAQIYVFIGAFEEARRIILQKTSKAVPGKRKSIGDVMTLGRLSSGLQSNNWTVQSA
jgi:hypothetical protein